MFCDQHAEQIEKYYNDVVDACLKAANDCIPLHKQRSHSYIPGFNQYVREKKESAILWHRIWKSNNCPRHGVIADIRRKAIRLFLTSDLQFGYKRGHSTTSCSFVAMEAVNHYVQRGANVYSVLLDASKAFDRVQYVRLFKLLLKKHACPLLARFMLLSYITQKLCVKWDGVLSEKFSATNGVKQGGVLSPVLFAIYMDELLYRLKTSGVGCRIGHVFLGALAYADDLQILAPTRYALKKMLAICEQFSAEFDVKFNADKSFLLDFGDQSGSAPMFLLNGKTIPSVAIEKHLGNMFGPGLVNQHIEHAVADLYVRTNLLAATFGNCHFHVKYSLFRSFCTAAYGSQLWDFSARNVDKFYVAWRKCVRRILNVPNTTHCVLLPLICDDVTIDTQLHKRFLTFFRNCSASDNECIRLCASLALHGSRSTVCRSLNYVCHKYGINKYRVKDVCATVVNDNFGDLRGDQINLCKAGAIKDLLYIRDSHSSELTNNEINFILEQLCCF